MNELKNKYPFSYTLLGLFVMFILSLLAGTAATITIAFWIRIFRQIAYS